MSAKFAKGCFTNITSKRRAMKKYLYIDSCNIWNSCVYILHHFMLAAFRSFGSTQRNKRNPTTQLICCSNISISKFNFNYDILYTVQFCETEENLLWYLKKSLTRSIALPGLTWNLSMPTSWKFIKNAILIFIVVYLYQKPLGIKPFWTIVRIVDL